MIEFFMNNWLGIILATSTAVVISVLWYSDFMFGKEWRRVTKLKDKEFMDNLLLSIVGLVVISFVSAFVLKRFIVIAAPASILEAIRLSIWVWIGFVATYGLSNTLFEKRSYELSVINLSNHLVTLTIMAAILYSVK
jgi:hypothetical protein